MAYEPDKLEEIVIRVNNGENWQLYAQQLLDDVRRDPECLALIVGSVKPEFKDQKIYAIFQSLFSYLGNKYTLTPFKFFPPLFLEKPWFPGDIENLKAMSIKESPKEFRRNNIFVLKNFLERV